MERWLSGLLPTADRVSEKLREARTETQIRAVFGKLLRRLEEVAGFELGSAGDPGQTVPGGMTGTDGMEVPVERAAKKKERDASYSGKKKRHTCKSNVTVNAKGALLGHSGLEPGSTHDLTVSRKSEPDLGMITRCMKGESEAMQITELVDKGFRGLDKHHPGSRIMMPLPRRATPRRQRRTTTG